SYAIPRCSVDEPALTEVEGQLVACHLFNAA
ncbi:MAG: hypothetical protein QOG73_1496, partial [Acetobacteraceae bacterium]|nr:hypothetical protein [Acetobacteraceae bacterium]